MYNPNIHHRHSIRLKGYDYSQTGLYFVTICVQERSCLLGEIANGEMILNDAGRMIEREWLNLKNRFSDIELHEFVIMPNHFHGIIQINLVGATLVVAQFDETSNSEEGQPQEIAPTKTVGDMIGAFKSTTTVEYIRGVKTLNWRPFYGKLWQRNYYEHIIRNEKSYCLIADYIVTNPMKQTEDKFYVG